MHPPAASQTNRLTASQPARRTDGPTCRMLGKGHSRWCCCRKRSARTDVVAGVCVCVRVRVRVRVSVCVCVCPEVSDDMGAAQHSTAPQTTNSPLTDQTTRQQQQQVFQVSIAPLSQSPSLPIIHRPHQPDEYKIPKRPAQKAAARDIYCTDVVWMSWMDGPMRSCLYAMPVGRYPALCTARVCG